MKKLYLVGIALIVMLVSVSTVSAGIFDFLGGSDEKILKIESEDSSLNGKLQITEYKNIEKQGDYYYEDDFEEGAINDILIENGNAEYKLQDDTEFFKVGYFIDDISSNLDENDTPMVTVKYLLNNKTILSSSNEAELSDGYGDCSVSFGDDVYTVDGKALNLK